MLSASACCSMRYTSQWLMSVAQYVYQRPPSRIHDALTSACIGVKCSSSVTIIMKSVAKLICGQRLPYTTTSDSTNVSGTTVSQSVTTCAVAMPVSKRGEEADHRARQHLVVLVLERAGHVDDARAQRAGRDREAEFAVMKHDQHQDGGKRNAERDAQAAEKVLAVDEFSDFDRVRHRLPDLPLDCALCVVCLARRRSHIRERAPENVASSLTQPEAVLT